MKAQVKGGVGDHAVVDRAADHAVDLFPAAQRPRQRDVPGGGTELLVDRSFLVGQLHRRTNHENTVGRPILRPNDFASMEEVVYRRYKRLLDEEQELPQIIS